MSKVIVIISDCHLSAGRFFEGQKNPHEDFHFDEEMVELIEHFSSGPYRPISVELVIAGDFFDFLNVPIDGEFEEAVSEKMAGKKLDAIFQGHPEVMDAIRRFASVQDKKVTYLIGNHDADLFYPSICERITRRWDPMAEFPSEVVQVLGTTDRIDLAPGIQVRHGNQLEAGSHLPFEAPFLTDGWDEPVLNLPWSSVYVMKIVNRLKWEREYLDKIRPVKVFIIFGLILDPLFTFKFCFLTSFYFIKTRISLSHRWWIKFRQWYTRLRQETQLFLDLEAEAREILLKEPEIKTLIMGHTHRPMHKVYPSGKQYLNTGSWVRMLDLDFRGMLGAERNHRTFALITIDNEGHSQCELRQWNGKHRSHRVFEGF